MLRGNQSKEQGYTRYAHLLFVHSVHHVFPFSNTPKDKGCPSPSYVHIIPASQDSDLFGLNPGATRRRAESIGVKQVKHSLALDSACNLRDRQCRILRLE